jgi:lipopolysaccharide export system protein LptA
MKRRAFLAAVAPIIALASQARAQAPAAGDESSRLDLGGPGATSKTGTGTLAVPAVAGAAKPDGKVAKAPKAPTEINANEAMFDSKANLAVFSGSVDVVDPGFLVTCDKLTVYLKAKPKAGAAKPAEEVRPIGADAKAPEKAADDPADDNSSGALDKAIAEGNAKITMIKTPAPGAKPERNVGTGKKAVYVSDKQICTLTGWPHAYQYMNNVLVKEIIAKSEDTVMVVNPDRIDVTGPHTTRLFDKSALEEQPGNGKR